MAPARTGNRLEPWLILLLMPVRMKDIAADLGLSVVTISKVLRNHPDISEETRARVMQRVRELRYRPNVTARSLVTGRSYLIGLVVPDLMHPFFSEVARSMARHLRERGYSLILASSEEDTAIEESEIEHMLDRQLDGLVIAASTTSPDLFVRLTEQKQAYVLIDRDLAGIDANFVGIDDVAAGMLATRHLLDLGCRRIAHIQGRDYSTGARRLEGYRKALEEAGRAYDERYVVARKRQDSESRLEGADAMRQLLRLDPRPDGVFCFNDPMAIGAMSVLFAEGIRIPKDIAVIGCGDLNYDELLRVPLSTLNQQTSKIGELASDLILGMVETNQPPKPRRIVLEPTLVPRASTALRAGQ